MAAKKPEEKRKEEVEAAIRSLFDIFQVPETRYGCPKVDTRETIEIEKRIEERKQKLHYDNDPEIKKLRKELSDLKCKVVAESTKQKAKVDELLRRLRIRGESSDLLDDIERLSKEKPAYVPSCGC